MKSQKKTYQYPYKGYSDSGMLKVIYNASFDVNAAEYDERWEYDIEHVYHIDSDGRTSSDLFQMMQNCDLFEDTLDQIKDKIDNVCEDEWLSLKGEDLHPELYEYQTEY